MRDCLDGLRYLHSKGVTHGQLTPRNILVDASQNLFISDYGSFHISQHARSWRVSLYSSPESLEGSLTPASDIWALGCILYELCCGRPPFPAASVAELCAKLRDPPQVFPHSGYSSDLCELILSMLASNPEKRPTAGQLLGHKLLLSINVAGKEDTCPDIEPLLEEAKKLLSTSISATSARKTLAVFEGLRNSRHDAEIAQRIGQLHCFLGDYATALASLLKSLALCFSPAPELLLDLACAYGHTGNPDKSAELARKALIGPGIDIGQQVVAHATLADSMVECEDIAAAEEESQKALEIAQTGTAAQRLTALKVRGRVRLAESDFPAAKNLLKDALGIYSADRVSIEKAEILAGLAEASEGTGDKPGAITYVKEAIEVYNAMQIENVDLALLYERLGELHGAGHELADQAYSAAIELHKKVGDDLSLGQCYYEIASAFENEDNDSEQGETRQIEFAQKVVELGRDKDLSTAPRLASVVAQAHNMVARLEDKRGNLKEALADFDRSVLLAKIVPDHKLAAELHEDAATAHWKANSYSLCASYASEAMRLHDSIMPETEREPVKVAELNVVQGKALGKLARWKEAERCFASAEETFSRGKLADESMAHVLINLSAAKDNTGDRKGSLEAAQRAVAIYERIKSCSLDAANAYKVLGVVEGRAGNWTRQISATLKAVELYKQLNLENTGYVATCYCYMAVAFGNLGNRGKKQEFARKGMGLFENLRCETAEGAYALVTYGLACGSATDWAKQAECSVRAIEIYRKLGMEGRDLAFAYQCLGAALGNQGNTKERIENYEWSAELYEKYGPETAECATTCFFLAMSYRQESKRDKALRYGEKAYEIRRAQLGEGSKATKSVKSFLEELAPSKA